MEQPNTLKI